tara:strand:+ start:10851 stop:11048 length:198 start_codon:yes stop_codon:yes gene_type:complete
MPITKVKKGSVFSDEEQDKKIEFSVRDTDFLIKMIMRSTFEGSELKVAYNVLEKLTELHRRNLEK